MTFHLIVPLPSTTVVVVVVVYLSTILSSTITSPVSLQNHPYSLISSPCPANYISFRGGFRMRQQRFKVKKKVFQTKKVNGFLHSFA